MSVLHHERAIEDLKYWLKMQNEKAGILDIKRRGNQFFYIKNKTTIPVPLELQEVCRLCEMENLV